MANNRPTERRTPVRPRVASLLRQVTLSFQNRIRPFRDSFSLILFSLLFGFLLANIFGTFLNILRDAVSWDGFVILGILLFVEMTNYLTYPRGSWATPGPRRPKGMGGRSPPKAQGPPLGDRRRGGQALGGRGPHAEQSLEGPPLGDNRGGRARHRASKATIANREGIYRIVNSFKIGLLLGFFVEAFKVGS
jgi:hypothetical protein